jgi:uracil-DNA glycosylase
MFLDLPRGFRDQARVAERLGMLGSPRIVPLQEWATELHLQRRQPVPHFDPAGGGVEARVLIVQESPGPAAAGGHRTGSGFASIDNDDPAAAQLWQLHSEAGPNQSDCVHWNIVPWHLPLGATKPDAADLRDGCAAMLDLLKLLRNVEVVILSGLLAQKGWHRFVRPARRDLPVIDTWHPSPLSMKQPGKREELRAALAAAERRIEVTGSMRSRTAATV